MIDFKITAICLILVAFTGGVSAQDSLLRLLDDSLSGHAPRGHVTGTFKGTRLINMQTIEAPGAGSLNFIIQHRFGQLNSGAYNLFGLDNATLRFGLEYGLSDRLEVGVGRSTVDKTFDGFAKYKVLRQTDGSDRMPLSLSVLGAIGYYTQQYPDKDYLNGTYRTAYVGELLLARKFSRRLSLELTPAWLHYNLVPTAADKNDEFAIGGGGRLKITRRMSIDAEYHYLLPNQLVSEKVYNSFSLGWEIETGGHVFQLVFTNSQGLIESQYIGRTTDSWGDGGIYFGFNISRNFDLVRHATRQINQRLP